MLSKISPGVAFIPPLFVKSGWPILTLPPHSQQPLAVGRTSTCVTFTVCGLHDWCCQTFCRLNCMHHVILQCDMGPYCRRAPGCNEHLRPLCELQGYFGITDGATDACASPSLIPMALVQIKRLRYLLRAFPRLHGGRGPMQMRESLCPCAHALLQTWTQRQRSYEEAH